ncbi:hypothetical protein EZL74_02480 [Flavobacterium silvisoli]|uniref:Uncharacterized protein n=1 Tax=Flavobacterium silvisoli TaxID=2529433 RepID=A0A4Q9Z2X5_9FLAO|nr:hypothetical protein [Flavobacterium silvisoli]TBX70560.1 hypothetical protein EZL74_02480 [Flavobacterium silvisoli]
MKNLNKKLIIAVIIELTVLVSSLILNSSYFLLCILAVSLTNSIAIILLLKHKPKYYRFAIVGLFLFSLLPVLLALYLVNQIHG